MEGFINKFECHYCGEHIDGEDLECKKCGAFLGKTEKNKPFLFFLLFISGCFALFTLWVGYNFFFSN